MLSEKSVDVAERRLSLTKEILRIMYNRSLISPEIREIMLGYTDNEKIGKNETKYKLNELRERILKNNGNNGHKMKNDEDILEPWVYVS